MSNEEGEDNHPSGQDHDLGEGIGEATKTEEEDMLSDGDQDDSVAGPDDPFKKKQKRRSKNDVNGRDFKCTFCDKTYLSYPALYTHMKNKHAKGPDGQPLIAFNSGRGRGRPKKNSLGSRNHVEPTSSFFFRTIDKVGGPMEPTQGFSEIYTEIFIKKKSKAFGDEDNDSAKEDQDQDQEGETVKDADDADIEMDDKPEL